MATDDSVTLGAEYMNIIIVIIFIVIIIIFQFTKKSPLLTGRRKLEKIHSLHHKYTFIKADNFIRKY